MDTVDHTLLKETHVDILHSLLFKHSDIASIVVVINIVRLYALGFFNFPELFLPCLYPLRN